MFIYGMTGFFVELFEEIFSRVTINGISRRAGVKYSDGFVVGGNEQKRKIIRKAGFQMNTKTKSAKFLK